MSRPPLIVIVPGAALLDFESEGDGVRVTCPGCGASHLYRPRPGTHAAAFEHEDACLVHARIQAAVATYERAVVRKG